jgi:NADH:ubiquinone oxidoreductase subunit E
VIDLITISVCVGSACHLKGSYKVIDKIQKLIDESHLGGSISLKAEFCIGECTMAVTVKVKDDIYSLKEDDVEEFFEKIVSGRL